MKEARVKVQTGRPNPADRHKGHNPKSPTSTVAITTGKAATPVPQSIALDPCHEPDDMRSRIERLDFAMARGWLRVDEAADFLGLSRKTIYNLKLKGKLKPMNTTSRRKLIFDLDELNRFLTGTNE